MRFSFITCTYNRAEHLPKTLKALCEQTFLGKNYEIVVIDNNSTDNTVEVCNEFINEYTFKQIRYFKEVSQGLSYALNRGIKEAKGEYIIYVDDDETIGKKHLELLNEYLIQFPDAELCASPVTPIYEERTPKWMSIFTQRLIGGYFNLGKDVKILDKTRYPGTGHTIIKRELYAKFGTYNTELGRKGSSLMGAEDKDMAFRLIENNVTCYYFPDIPIYHHIPAYKLTNEFFSKLTYSIGKSERVRTLAISKKAYRARLFQEVIKWIASFILFFFFLITLRPSKGVKLLEFRWNVTKGLLYSHSEIY